MRVILLILIILYSQVAGAFNWEGCKNLVFPKGHNLNKLFYSTSSTSSFLTSTGDCAMIGMREHDKKVFIAQSLDQLKLESALGHGEYLANYSAMIGCSENASGEFFKSLKNNFNNVFGEKVKLPPKLVYKNIETLIQNDPILKQNCTPKS